MQQQWEAHTASSPPDLYIAVLGSRAGRMFAGDNEVIKVAGNVLPELHRPGGGGVKNLFFEGHRKENSV